MYVNDCRTKEFLRCAIQDNDFLKNLSSVNIRDIVDCMYSVDYKKDSVIIKEGDVGSRLYIAEGKSSSFGQYSWVS